jgi:hypothetical protein
MAKSARGSADGTAGPGCDTVGDTRHPNQEGFRGSVYCTREAEFWADANYFSNYQDPNLFEGTERQFNTWENLPTEPPSTSDTPT